MRQQENKNGRPWWRVAAVTSALLLIAAACGDDDDSDTTTDDDTTTTVADDEAAAPAGGSGPCPDTGETLQVGSIAWDEDVAVQALWSTLLEEQGYELEPTELDVGPIYDGLANGDLHLFFDSWQPLTHGSYIDQYGEEITSLGEWNDQASLELAVPEYMGIESMEDLADIADDVDSQIIGIEPGSGIMELTLDPLLADYGLDDWTLVEGSTPSMLTELETAIENEEPIVVTLWHPHWAYDVYDLTDLEDPEGSFGEDEHIEISACGAFAEDHADVAEWLTNFSLDSEQLASLENLMFNEYDSGEEAEAVDEWLSDSENRALADSWIGGDGATDDADDADDADAEDEE
jgi:glycine betaine/proline transport system substrate-binding protein